MKNIMLSTHNGVVQGAKIGGMISAASFLTIVGILSYELSRTSPDRGNMTVAASLFGLMILAPGFCAIYGAIQGSVNGIVNGIYTTLYDNRRKVEHEIVLPQYQDDQLITLRKTRQIEIT